MRLRILSLSALLFAACPPSDEDCASAVADDGGTIAPIPGFPAVGQKLVQLVRAPLTTCRTSTTATVQIFSPGNRPREGTVEAVTIEPTSTAGLSTATARVSFTPDVPGSWTISVAFDGLGARSSTADVLPSYSSDAGIVFSLPTGVGCPFGPWVLEDQLHALCEQPDASIAIFAITGDGGVTTLSGTQLAVAGDVAWLMNSDGVSLERYVWDGGLQLTDRWDGGFTLSRVRGEHTRTRAVRLQRNDIVRAIDVERGIDIAQGIGVSVADGFFFLEPDLPEPIQERRGNIASQSTVAFEPRAIWSGGSAAPFATMERRPLNPLIPGGIPVTLPSSANLPLLPDVQPFERIPMWVRTDKGSVYFAVAPSGLSVSVWPNRPLFRATEGFLLFADPNTAGVFQLIPR